MQSSFVVTGGARGVGEAITRRTARLGMVIVCDTVEKLTWEDPAIDLVYGDAQNPRIALQAAERAERAGPLTGGVNVGTI